MCPCCGESVRWRCNSAFGYLQILPFRTLTDDEQLEPVRITLLDARANRP